MKKNFLFKITMNKYLPINKQNLIKELIKNGIDINVINIIDWTKCIKEEYCSHVNNKGIICLSKKENKTIKFCNLHKDEIKIIEEDIKNMNINNDVNEISFNKCFYLDDHNIDKLYIKTKELTNVIKNCKDGTLEFNHLCNAMIEYNNLMYKTETEPYISISYFLQLLEEIYETSNGFFDSLLYDSKNHDDYDIFLKTCKKWKLRIKEVINEINVLPEYYKEYYIILNRKIDDNLFKIIK